MLADPAVEPSRHKCLIYDGEPSEQLSVIIPFLKDGLENNWRCLYIGSPKMIGMMQSALTEHDVDLVQETKRGALVLSSERNLLSDGAFEPRKMIGALCHLVDTAVGDGFNGLCATGDMKWELGRDRNFDRLLEYEARLEQVFRDKPIRGICQYHRDLVPPHSVRDALFTHRSVHVGGALDSDNLFYIPPELLLDARKTGNSAKQAEWMCQQIARAAKTEKQRDDTVAGLCAPLKSITGSSKMLYDAFRDSLPAQGRKHLDRVCASAKHLEQLMNSLVPSRA